MGGFLNIILIWIGSVIPANSDALAWKNDSSAIPIHSSVKKSQTIEITDSYEIINSHEVTVTVFHPEGLNHAQIIIPYDDLTTITSFSGTIRNPLTGKAIQKLRLKDLQDRSWISDFSVFEDNRLKSFSIHSGTFPLEISYQVSTTTKGNFNIPSWYPNPDAYQKVAKANLKVIYPKDKGIRYLPLHLSARPDERDSLGTAILEWQEDSLSTYADGDAEAHKLSFDWHPFNSPWKATPPPWMTGKDSADGSTY